MGGWQYIADSYFHLQGTFVICSFELPGYFCSLLSPAIDSSWLSILLTLPVFVYPLTPFSDNLLGKVVTGMFQKNEKHLQSALFNSLG